MRVTIINTNTIEHARTAIFWRTQAIKFWGAKKYEQFKNELFQPNSGCNAKICAKVFEQEIIFASVSKIRGTICSR